MEVLERAEAPHREFASEFSGGVTEPVPSVANIRFQAEPDLSIGWRVAIFLAACFVVFLRRPDAILHPRFYAEDGAIWYATAHNYGWWRVLFSPYQGYVHFVPRLVAGFALLFPLRWAPLVLNATAIAIEAIPVVLLLSPRCRSWGSWRVRLLLSLLYLLSPNAEELLGCITESQWILALCVLLIVLAQPSVSKFARIADVALVTLAALTGPFCIFLIPAAFYQLRRERDEPWRKTVLLLLSVGASIQILSFLLHPASRCHVSLGASPALLVRIVAAQVYFGALIGPNLLGLSLSAAVLCMTAVGTALVVSCWLIAAAEMRILLAITGALFAAVLASPVAFPPPGHTAWEVLCNSPGAHYWFFPCLAFLWALVFCARAKNSFLRIAATSLLMMSVAGLIQGFEYPLHADRMFPDYARQFDKAPAGATIAIPLQPRGWQAILRKK